MIIMGLKETLKSTNTLVALPDVHSKTTARVKAQELIAAGLVKRFFIEWSSAAKGKDGLLNNVFSAIHQAHESGKKAPYLSKLDVADPEAIEEYLRGGQYFKGMAKDKEPGLPTLAALAASKGAQVVAMDLDKAAGMLALKKLYEEKGWGAVQESFLFQASGLKVRDEYAGSEIAKFLIEGPDTTGRLMMWGANHFDADEDFKKGLGDIIQDYRHQRMKNRTVKVLVWNNKDK
jgi:hypothetical protein